MQTFHLTAATERFITLSAYFTLSSLQEINEV